MTNIADRPRELGLHEPSLPRAPQSVEETGLNFLFLVELLCKTLYLHGQMRLVDIASHSKLSLGVLEPVFAFMRAEHLCEVSRRSDAETTITYVLTELGRLRAQDFLIKSQYAGAAPVPLAAYTERVREQSILDLQVTRERIEEVFKGIVLRAGLLDQLGPAMNSGRAIFVYGPAGGGKTFFAEHLAGLLAGKPAIPYAILVDSEVVQVFDPLLHQAVAHASNGSSLDRGNGFDGRWVACHRPVVFTGGELTLPMLDLDFDQTSRFYQAPPQVKANNGLLVIDDLGRQLVSPQSLMNRWIVPLDRRVDYLALHTGTKFMVPFDVMVVFSSNLPPASLADDAFLRRLGYKLHIGPLPEQEYRTIFKQVCAGFGIPYSEPAFGHVLHELHYKKQQPLLACVPRDLLQQVRDRAQYQGVEPTLSEEALDWAWNNYYAKE